MESRTSKSLKNARIALVFYFFNLLLQFFSRKIFLDYLGAEVLGLNSTAQNLLGFLNLAELGVDVAVSYMLYKPVLNKNVQIINDIVTVQGWLYRKVAYVVMGTATVLMLFFPWIFAKIEIPLWYAYGTFIAFLISSLLGYFINYRQIVLTTDQKQYKVTTVIQSVKIIKVILQISAISLFRNGYLWWLVLEVIMTFVTSIVLNYTIKKEYPWLDTKLANGKRLKDTYPEIVVKTKQIFFHRVANFVLTQTSPLVIYAYASLSLVAVYGNYMLIVTGITMLVAALLNSITAGVGNLVAEGSKNQIKKVFWELTSFRVWLAAIICYVFYRSGHSFITLWVGKEYLLPDSVFYILIAITYITLTRTNDAFILAYGIFQDIWAPVIEAILNLGGAIILGYFWGLPGILTGVLLSLILVVVCWKSYFLYTYGFKEKIWEYVQKQGKYIVMIVVSVLLHEFILSSVMVDNNAESFFSWGIYVVGLMISFALIISIVFYLGDNSIKCFFQRLIKIIR